jgi:hypothetical protein
MRFFLGESAEVTSDDFRLDAEDPELRGFSPPDQGLGQPGLYLFVPPLLLSMLNVPSPTYPPEGWFVHPWLGTSFAFPMSWEYDEPFP